MILLLKIRSHVFFGGVTGDADRLELRDDVSSECPCLGIEEGGVVDNIEEHEEEVLAVLPLSILPLSLGIPNAFVCVCWVSSLNAVGRNSGGEDDGLCLAFLMVTKDNCCIW